jgi:hypothetical protein
LKSKLALFSSFANSLYPHETDYLLSVQKFQKSDNLKVLQLINYNSKNPLNLLPYDKSIDKRTYSYLKKWVSETLSKIDVDNFYDWLVGIERSVMNDSISPDQEKTLIDKAAAISPANYYFLKFYEVIQLYRDYLMVRNRTVYYSIVSLFLNQYRSEYLSASELNIKLNQAAEKIVSEVSSEGKEFLHWEKLFKENFFNEKLDGYTRYRAVVRLTILYYTNREFDKLRSIYEHLDSMFKTDVFYSRRILSNYYANRAMMHSKLNELDLAESFGYLSIRRKNSDYLFYLVNLCGVLLRREKNHEALQILVHSIPELKKTSSYYYKIGFVAFYIKTLVAVNQVRKAVDYGTSYLESYKKEIFEHRWHLFFSAYLQALLRAEKYARVLSLNRRFKLLVLERQTKGKAIYVPLIFWYIILAEYMEGTISSEELKQSILKSGQELLDNEYKHRKINELLDDIAVTIPDIIREVREELSLHG